MLKIQANRCIVWINFDGLLFRGVETFSDTLQSLVPWRESMRQTSLLTVIVAAMMTASAQAQVGSPGIEYGNTISAGDGVQLYPYDQQDPWLHGHFQRVPSYGGFASFRPYNYRHVFAQTQLAQQWGHAHGMPYSQQFWNRYRSSYLEGNLHSAYQPEIPNPQTQSYPAPTYPGQAYPQQQQQYSNQVYQGQGYPVQTSPNQGAPNNAYPVSAVRPIGYQTQNVFEQPTSQHRDTMPPVSAERPIHVFPERVTNR